MKQLVLTAMMSVALCSPMLSSHAKTTPVASVVKQDNKAINLNTASAKELNQAFRGLGMRRAKAVVAYRKKHGQFSSVAQLAKIKLFTKAYMKRNLPGLEKAFVVT